MPNTVEQQQESIPTYSQLIHEAFIDPIRSVTVIDDEYPTFAELLSKTIIPAASSDIAHTRQSTEQHSFKPENIERLKSIIDLCHFEKKWSIDVYDGKSPEIGGQDSIPHHLGHSDLIVLDYHLDGEASTDNGERARQIIRSLENNNHFNMIIVHTKGSESNDIQQVFDEILCLFVSRDKTYPYDVNEENNGIIDDWVDINENNNQFSFLNINMGLQNCLLSLDSSEKALLATRSPKHLLHSFEAELIQLSSTISSDSKCEIEKNDLIKWYFHDQFKKHKDNFEGICKKGFQWKWAPENSLNFIQTGHVFITVIKKSNIDPKIELIESLEKALTEWNAPPMHLLMAKMRHLIDEKGLEQANKIIAYREAQAGWLYNLIDSNNNGNSFPAHDIVINAHWEQLARKTKNEIRNFSMSLINAISRDKKESSINIVKKFFPECQSDPNKTLAFLNAFTCSQLVLEKNLTTGTVLKINNEYWVCLSPACDITPRINGRWKERIGEDKLAFKAVKIESITNHKNANEKANSNNYIYIIENHEPKIFSFIDKEGSNPSWDIFYASNLGCFNDDNKLDVSFLRLNNSEDSTELKIIKETASVIAELRYEYALNFLQKLGANQSRVGLGFTDSENFMRN
ncbi:response regulator receiver domain [Providencia rettgeri]|uniref:response regulator receiver domain n=1 Tax=Providencia rettgeri TaxID=587 RepID=UPI0025520B96|nr:response regulator receiver domain [Providencia rettgeri]MDK7746247.1 response regulator receiver domain [Providencia rettgeri]MDK7758810.1 response regulator receiver domain [Providencia rettgeri]